MLLYLQRVVTTFAVTLWFGGFTLYTAYIVRVGSRIVGGVPQGYVTQQVTDMLNVLAAIMVGAVIVDIAASWRGTSKWMRSLQCTAWLVMAVSLVGLIIVHNMMDALLDPATLAKPDHDAFSPLHQGYQMISTFQWFASLAYIAQLLPDSCMA